MFKFGDIIENPWVTADSPLYHTVFIRNTGKFFETVEQPNFRKFHKYYKSDRNEFKKVGSVLADERTC